MTQGLDDVETVEDLSRPEHLLVWAMRAIALGHEDCPALVRAFRAAGGALGDELLQSYVVFIKYLALASRRRLQVHTPGCLCVGADELRALQVIASAQRSLRSRDERSLRAALGELTGRGPDESILLVAQGLARLLDAVGVALPSRRDAAESQWAEAGVTLRAMLN